VEPFFKMKVGNGDEFDITDKIPDLKYLGVDDASSSPQFTNNYQDLSGKDGSFFVSQTLAKRTFNERFVLFTRNWEEYQLAKHEIYKLFGQRKLIRVRTDINSAKVYFGYVNAFDISPIQSGANYANLTIPFDLPKPYRYSLYRSDSPYTFKQAGWQFGMNIPSRDVLNYHFMTSSFRVYNASDIKVDPYFQNHDLKMIIKFNGSSLKVHNKTTDTTWTYNESSDGSHTIIWDGQLLSTYLDGNQVNGKTDFGYLSLDPEWNDIECTGANSVDITFSFPFIYLI
jgi:phage-related protein